MRLLMHSSTSLIFVYSLLASCSSVALKPFSRPALKSVFLSSGTLTTNRPHTSLGNQWSKLYSNTVDAEKETSNIVELRPPPLVQRTFETFRWNDKYNINYRVEGPVDGKPILLVHGFGANAVSEVFLS